jgi:hypothetical protein
MPSATLLRSRASPALQPLQQQGCGPASSSEHSLDSTAAASCCQASNSWRRRASFAAVGRDSVPDSHCGSVATARCGRLQGRKQPTPAALSRRLCAPTPLPLLGCSLLPGPLADARRSLCVGRAGRRCVWRLPEPQCEVRTSCGALVGASALWWTQGLGWAAWLLQLLLDGLLKPACPPAACQLPSPAAVRCQETAAVKRPCIQSSTAIRPFANAIAREPYPPAKPVAGGHR